MENDKLDTPKLPAPTWVSPEGYPWYLDNRATEHAQSLLPGHTVWLMKNQYDRYVYVLMCGPVIQFAHDTIDGVGKEIDRRAFLALNGTRKH